MTASEMDRAIETLARHQHGVFNNRQAHDLGASPRMIRRRRDTGRWQQLSHTVWALPSAPASWHRQVMAAVLSLPGSAVSGLAAGHLHGLEGFRSVRPELTVPRGGSRRSPFARVHQSDRVMRTVCGPFPVVTVEQAICDSAGRLGGRLEEVLVAAILAGRTSADAVLARAASLLPHPPRGTGALLEVASELSRTDAVPMSVLEAVLALVHDHRTLRFSHQQLVHEPSYALEVILAVGANTAPSTLNRGGR